MSDPIRRAIISVSDKSGLAELVQALEKRGVEILSTGGTAADLRDAGVAVKEVSDYTGFPEILDGRVKTLHPRVHGGLLARRGHKGDEEQMAAQDISPIDLIVVNLYPFEQTVASGADYDTCIENIDIGGPAMIRAASKNHASVTVIVEPEDYETLLNELESNDGATSRDFRKKMAAKAYRRTGAYDAAIGSWFADVLDEPFPERIVMAGELRQELRYGENSHQSAAFYTNSENRPGIATATQLQGKELSFNNLNDTDAAFELVAEFQDTACAIIKHANPCGVALADGLKEAYLRALSCDTESAFGGIIAFNQTLDAETAKEVADLFAEVVIAPEIDAAAMDIFAAKKNLRVLETGGLPDPTSGGMTVRTLAGGYLFQGRDAAITDGDLKVVTKREPTEQELQDLLFAFTVGKHVKSNAIIYAKNGMTVGVGAGQMSRVNSSRIATWKAADAAEKAGDAKSWAEGSVVASDAFFPFADGLLAAAEAGATAVIQPGGSIRDDEVIAAADEKGLAMVFTGMRHFRH
jgi:phosphoribosylaminoimidazolecarboxamide formyltransferase/IMP cyclohydrolase